MDTNKKHHQQLQLRRRICTIFLASFSSCRHDDTTTKKSTTPSPSKNPKLPKSPTHPFPSIQHKPDPTRQKLSESYSLFYSAHAAPLLEKRSMEKTRTRQRQNMDKTQSKRDKKERRKRRELKKARSFVASSEDEEVGLIPQRRRRADMKTVVEDRDSDCYAVIKCSKDPLTDFKSSMVEMIVEKRMRKTEEMERLLQSFLRINSYRHHAIIIEAFMDIWDALFLM